VPLRLRDAVRSFVRDCDTALRRYLRAQIVVMGAMAAFYSAGLLVTGLTLALPIGIFTGLAVFIPYLGYGTGLVLALLTATITFADWHGVAAVAGVYVAGQVLESFILTPRLVGGRIGLSPLGVIVILLLFGEAFGFAGVLLSLPASAVGMVAVHRLLARYRASDFYRT
jgi:predicted PurR-regulated permease PerM